jgi:hypothetical protein
MYETQHISEMLGYAIANPAYDFSLILASYVILSIIKIKAIHPLKLINNFRCIVST